MYEIKKPITAFEKSDFIVKYEREQGLKIVETDMYLFALEANETMGTKKIKEIVYDYDENGEVTGSHKVTVTIPYPVENTNYEEEQAQKQREEIAKLKLTKREVFLALYAAKEITPDMVRANITDTPALIEFDYATEYYRGNPLIDSIGGMLGYTSEDLDYLFINKKLPEKAEE